MCIAHITYVYLKVSKKFSSEKVGSDPPLNGQQQPKNFNYCIWSLLNEQSVGYLLLRLADNDGWVMGRQFPINLFAT